MATVRAQSITSKSSFNAGGLERALIGALDQATKVVEKDYNATTVTWRHRARASIEKPASNERVIGVDDRIWQMLDEGTRAHAIRPRSARRLAFKTGFVPKTQPSVIGSGPGGSSGNTVFARGVQHPGTKARKWTDAISTKNDAVLPDLVDKVLEGFDL
jgi:hypothetical protein